MNDTAIDKHHVQSIDILKEIKKFAIQVKDTKNYKIKIWDYLEQDNLVSGYKIIVYAVVGNEKVAIPYVLKFMEIDTVKYDWKEHLKNLLNELVHEIDISIENNIE
nr:hypothetical protein [Methanobrevibacter arboriphilus]